MRIISILVVGAALLLLASSALPRQASGATAALWPGEEITYFDASRNSAAVGIAVRAWHRTGIGIRFRRTYRRRDADFVILNSREVPGGCGSGLATFGYEGAGIQGFIKILAGVPEDGQACATPGQAMVLAHELGHILGMNHYDGSCSIMNTTHLDGISPAICVRGTAFRTTRRGQWRCRLVEPRDARLAVRMYGGRYRAPLPNPWCDLVRRSDAPEVVGLHRRDDASIEIELRRPPTSYVPPYLRGQVVTPGYRVDLRSNCPDTSPTFTATRVALSPWFVGVGDSEVATVALPDGSVDACFSVWALDSLGRLSAKSSAVDTRLAVS